MPHYLCAIADWKCADLQANEALSGVLEHLTAAREPPAHLVASASELRDVANWRFRIMIEAMRANTATLARQRDFCCVAMP